MGKYSDMKISDMYETLCKELCCEMEKFEENPNKETLSCIKELLETMNELQEIEAGKAMRDFAEERLGYEMDEGFYPYSSYEYSRFPSLYNDGRTGRGNRSGDGRRKSNGGNRGGQRGYNDYSGNPSGYPTYGPNRGNIYPNGMPNYMRREENGRRARVDGGDDRMGMEWDYDNYDPDQTYMLRQENGKPQMTPYAMHTGTIPKKLTEDQYKEWMRDLANADGTSGPHWTMEQTKQVQQKANMTDIDPWVFYVAMNASYSDLCEFFKKHGLDDAMAYAEYVEAFWIDDEDSVGSDDPRAKLAAYYTSVVEH